MANKIKKLGQFWKNKSTITPKVFKTTAFMKRYDIILEYLDLSLKLSQLNFGKSQNSQENSIPND